MQHEYFPFYIKLHFNEERMNLINNNSFSDLFSFQIVPEYSFILTRCDKQNKKQNNNYEANILVYVSHLIHYYGKRENTTNLKMFIKRNVKEHR